MPNPTRIELRYFDVRGRAQFLRYFLLCRDIPFEDDRVSLANGFEAWEAIRPDRTVTGPFQKLPVLLWGDRLVAEATVIASFLHHTSGDAGRLSESENLQHQMMVSSAYVDLMLSMGILLWSELMFPGGDFATTAKRVLERVNSHLTALERTLIEWQWLERAATRPVMVADCILWDQINSVQHVFGDMVRLDATPTLARFYQDCPGRETFERLIQTKPCQVTARPGEADCIARIRELVAGG
jgi:glutathione S-transferase